MRTTLIMGLLVLSVAGAGAGQTMKYRVTTKVDKQTDFSKLKTYVWETGWTAYERSAHEQIIAAVERELGALGFAKGTAENCDVTVAYATVHRTDVDLKAKHNAEGIRPTFPVATLVVLIRDPGTHKELFRARSDTRIGVEPDAIEATINDQVAQMFARYPTRPANRR